MIEYDVIIPVYQPEKEFFLLLTMLEKQTVRPRRIILINTQRACFESLLSEAKLHELAPKATLFHITSEEFDHGATRNLGVSKGDSPYFVLMTDDAIPEDIYLMEHLLSPFQDEEVGMTYARQLPKDDCGVIERYTRSFNYPETSLVKSKEDIQELGIKAFFASNVCAAYRRTYFEELQGFTKKTIFNEDMIYARGLLDAGYRICYAADARVVHSHNYSGIEQLHRNFDLGVSHAMYPEVFAGLPTESEGIRLVKQTCRYLLQIHRPLLIFKLFWQSGCKYIGYFLGKRYRKLPSKMVRRLSMNRNFWNKKNEAAE